MNTINYMKIRFPKTTLKQFVLICNLIFTKKASISRDQPFYGNNTVLRWRLHLAPKAPTAFAFLGGCFDHVSLLFTPVTRRAIPVSFALIVAVVIERAVSVRQDIDRSLLSAPVPWRAITVRKHGARFLDHRLANSAPVACIAVLRVSLLVYYQFTPAAPITGWTVAVTSFRPAHKTPGAIRTIKLPPLLAPVSGGTIASLVF